MPENAIIITMINKNSIYEIDSVIINFVDETKLHK